MTSLRRTYYDKRVLLLVDDVLDSQFPDSLVCLTGAQAAMLRNLTQYLHRRSTWVAEYHDDYYIVPDDDEWNVIEALVAELEETLMGCAEMFATFEDMVSALQCLCTQLTALSSASPIPVDSVIEGQPIYDDYLSPVIEDEGDPPEGFATWDDWREYKCIGAQKVIDDLVAAMERIGAATGGGILVSYALVQAALAGLIVLPPLALVLMVASLLAVSGLSYIQSEARAWVAEHKEGLVCAIYGAEDVTTARAALYTYLDDEWDVVGDPQFCKTLLNNWLLSQLFDGSLPGYDEWSGDYSETYCTVCDLPTFPWLQEWNFLYTCPNDWVGTGVCWFYDAKDWLCVGNVLYKTSPIWYWPEDDTIDVILNIAYFSSHGIGNTVGYLYLQKSPNGVDSWSTVCSLTLTTSVGAYGINYGLQEFEDKAIDAGYYYRLNLTGQVGQGNTNPYPVNTAWIKCTWKEPD